MSSTKNEDVNVDQNVPLVHPDPLVEHVIHNVLRTSLSGRKYATRRTEAFLRFDYLTILDIVTLSSKN